MIDNIYLLNKGGIVEWSWDRLSDGPVNDNRIIQQLVNDVLAQERDIDRKEYLIPSSQKSICWRHLNESRQMIVVVTSFLESRQCQSYLQNIYDHYINKCSRDIDLWSSHCIKLAQHVSDDKTKITRPEQNSKNEKERKARKGRNWDAHVVGDETGCEDLDFSTASEQTSEKASDLAFDMKPQTIDALESPQSKSHSALMTAFPILSRISNYISSDSLNHESLAPALDQLRNHLLKKNVAIEVVDKLLTSVESSLIGQKKQSFTSVTSSVYEVLQTAIRRILTPSKPFNLLSEIQNSERPFVISLVGVNGVGKSTSLSKLAYFLVSNRCRVLVAACDTFRSGAVEQLATHVNNLKKMAGSNYSSDLIELFEKGYGKDMTAVANEAIKYAKSHKFDVVLIDTAGRRHNDQILMGSLEKFAKNVKINKIFQVAEALVGTDSLAQARHFSAALGKSRKMDGFIISKVDTVSDLVGTILSMVYISGIPVVYVGVGQMYPDLRTLSVEYITDLLLK